MKLAVRLFLGSALIASSLCAQEDDAPVPIPPAARRVLGEELCESLAKATELVVFDRTGEGEAVVIEGIAFHEVSRSSEASRLHRTCRKTFDERNFVRPDATPGFEAVRALRFEGPGGTETLLVSYAPSAFLWVEERVRIPFDPEGPLLDLLDPPPILDRRTVRLLEGADRLTLFRTLPDPGEVEGWPSIDGYPAYSERVVEGESMESVRRALLDPATWGDRLADCFFPRHAVRIRSGEEIVEILICFECDQASIQGVERELAFGTPPDSRRTPGTDARPSRPDRGAGLRMTHLTVRRAIDLGRGRGR